MPPSSSLSSESTRLALLELLAILDTPAEAAFDNLTCLAARLFDVPMALISFIDAERQWNKSTAGIQLESMPRQESLCSQVLAAETLLVIEDARRDPRFSHLPLVSADTGVRFYAGVPLKVEQQVLGTFCVMDRTPRQLDSRQIELLQLLAAQAEQLISLGTAQRLRDRQAGDSRAGGARYDAIIEGAAAGIVRINGRGQILEANPFVQEMLGYTLDEMIGRNVKMLMPARWSEAHDGYLEAYQRTGEARVIGTGREVEALHKDGHTIPVHLAVSEVVAEQGESATREFIGILSDLRDVHAARQYQERQRALLEVLHTGLTDYRALVSGNTLWEFLKEALRELTGSHYALIGEVVEQSGVSALKLHAITDLSWSDDSRRLMQQLVSGDMMLTNPDSMLGRVFAGGEVVLSNDMESDPRGGGLPPGHPALHRYLGVPIRDGSRVIGMYAIANADEDYDERLVAWLEPFTSTCALLINLYRQMNEQRDLNEELQRANARVERASQAKTEFLSSMSHELRTPLNSILGFAQLLLNGRQPLTERQQRQTEQIMRSGRHLLDLINEVLDLARIEAGKMQVSIEPVSLGDVIQEALEVMTPLADQQGIRLKWCQPERARVSVRADYTRMRQVLINLLSNAIKYNRVNGKVVVQCRSNADHVRVSVQDTGAGIAAGRMQELFLPFNRLGAESGSIEGTGVGLALTRKLVRLMQGEIGVSSEEGVGSEFWLELPLAHPAATSSESKSDSAQALEVQAEERRVLYIEDNPANQRLMIDLFEDIPGCELECVATAEEGIERACSEPPDLILMDIDLPGMNGFQAQQLLQRNPLTGSIPVIAISAAASTREIRQAREAGFVDYLTKPLDLVAFTRHVEQVLQAGDGL
ncbi:hypothetical protein GCM10009104_23000 [Marinobacterium maritimum]|uniref:histidine kinase n=1 Tax=Marinobacterium maritimum TaxID=500162 RepID=A0ABP3TDB3_9GAMM